MATSYWVQITWTVQDVNTFNTPDFGPLLTFQDEPLRFLTSSWAGEPYWAFNYTTAPWAAVPKGNWDPVLGNFQQAPYDYLVLHNDISDYYIVGTKPAPSTLVGPLEKYTRHDDLDRTDETFSFPQWGWAQITIQKNVLAGVYADAPVIVEGDSGTKQASFTISLSEAPVGPVTVTYSTKDGTAVGGTSAAQGTDFIQTTGSVTFLAGQTHLPVTVPIIGDTIPEESETFSLQIDGVSASDSTTTPVIDTAHASAQMQISDGGPLTADTQSVIEWAGHVLDLRKPVLQLFAATFGEGNKQILDDAEAYGNALEKLSGVAGVGLAVGSRYLELQSDLAHAQNAHEKWLAEEKWDVSLSNDLAKLAFVAALAPYASSVVGAAAAQEGVELALVGVAAALGVTVSAPIIISAGAAIVGGAALIHVWDEFLSDSFQRQQTLEFENRVGVVGTTFEGYIQGATVFADANGNKQLDTGESSAISDANGDFHLVAGSGPLVAFGGIDVSTGLSFKGQLLAPAGSTEITPLTTLLADLASDPTAETNVLSALGLSSTLNLTAFDPIAAAKGGSADGAATEVAGAKVYDTVEMIASALDGAGSTFSESLQDAFSALASTLESTGINLNDKIAVSALLTQVAHIEKITLGSGVADAISSIIAAGNNALDHILQTDQPGTKLLNDVAAVELVEQGAASSALMKAAGNLEKLQDTATTFTGGNLSNLIANGTIGGGWGDVHYTSFDGHKFDLQSTGDYVIAHATSGPKFEVDGRAENLGHQGVSYLTAIAVEAGDHNILFDEATPNTMLIDGKTVAFAVGGSLDLGDGVIVDRTAANTHEIKTSLDTIQIVDQGKYLNLSVHESAARLDSLEGLLGNFDGNAKNDFQLANGKSLVNPTTSVIEGSFADAWLLVQNTAAFTSLGNNTFEQRVAEAVHDPTPAISVHDAWHIV